MGIVKDDLRQIFLHTLENLSLDKVMSRRIKRQGDLLIASETRVDLSEYQKIVCISIGKAAVQMTEQFLCIVKPREVAGIVVSPAIPEKTIPNFRHYNGGHPYPNAESLQAASAILELVSNLHHEDLVVYLLSGGGSAICEKPISTDISLKDIQEFFHLLVTCGANIVEMNVLRKHFSAIKGGRLAERANPAGQVTFYVSDVPSDQPSTVASGPTMPDESTVEDCYRLSQNLKLAGQLPSSIQQMFDKKEIPETPSLESENFSRSSWHMLLGNKDGVDVLHDQVAPRGWIVERDLSVDDWPYEVAVRHLLERLENMRRNNPGETVVLLTGGELSVPVIGDGIGGRNQAFVLSCAHHIAGQNIAVLSAGTDGIDGNSPAAGAVADGETLARAHTAGMSVSDFERRSDSFHFFERLDDLLITGPTGNNIRDLRVMVAW